MNILFLSYFFEPDLSAGSFRNTSLFQEIENRLGASDHIEVLTTVPNRYDSYAEACEQVEKTKKGVIHRFAVPRQSSGFKGQINSFYRYYRSVLKHTRGKKYDLVYASSSKLFTAFLGRRIAKKSNARLFLDIRDIFVDTITDVFKNNKVFSFIVKHAFTPIERYTFSKADHINLVSKGFEGYFKTYSEPTYSYFTNGIDDVFLHCHKPTNRVSGKKVITYAGNIGEGQGLEKIIPNIAQSLGDDYLLRIIGDGGCKHLLQQVLESKGISNVEMLSPVKRDKLIEYYNATDFLFLHLNDYSAFEKVLPSKLFEYSVFPVPVIAGVSGYAAKFLEEEMPGSFVFKPCDHQAAVDFIQNYRKQEIIDRSAFIADYTRNQLMGRMAATILELS